MSHRPRGNIPQTDSLVTPTSPTSERRPIRTENNTQDRVRVSGEGMLHRPRGNIPQPDGIIVTPTGEGLAIRTECNARDSFRVFGEGMSHRPRGNIPQTDGVIVTPTSEGLAIRTERNARDTARVACQQGELLIGLRIVEPHTDRTRNRQQRSIGRIRQFIYLAFAQAQCRTLR